MTEYLNFEVDNTDSKLISVVDELPLWSAPFGLKLLDIIKLRKNIKALDVGCGLGFPLIELSQRLGPTSIVYGIDPWNEALDRVRLKLQVYNIKNIKLVNSAAEDMPFEDEYFDLIISNNGINNVQHLARTLKECCRISKPKAQMVFTLNTEESMIEFYSVFQEVLKEEGREDEIKRMKEHIYSKRKPIDEITTMTKDAGFSIEDVFHDSFELRFVDGTAMLNHSLIKYWFLDGWKQVLKPGDLIRIFDKVESKLNRQSEVDGIFKLTIPFVTFDCRRNS